MLLCKVLLPQPDIGYTCPYLHSYAISVISLYFITFDDVSCSELVRQRVTIPFSVWSKSDVTTALPVQTSCIYLISLDMYLFGCQFMKPPLKINFSMRVFAGTQKL